MKQIIEFSDIFNPILKHLSARIVHTEAYTQRSILSPFASSRCFIYSALSDFLLVYNFFPEPLFFNSLLIAIVVLLLLRYESESGDVAVVVVDDDDVMTVIRRSMSLPKTWTAGQLASSQRRQ